MSDKKYNILVLLTATPDWLRLSRTERRTFSGQVLTPLLAKYSSQVGVRWLDVEAFSARCSDIAIFETADLQSYYFLMEELRDTAIFSQPYFRLEEVIVGLEDGYQAFESAQS